jgi:predicted AlkP superfamily pyrophosphatase or phosphodiesterase
MRTSLLRPVFVCTLLIGVLLPVRSTRAAAQRPSAPKLVVLLMVDQMRADYLDRYGANHQQGLKRLETAGAWFTQAALPYMNTVTCAGHSTASTGTFPYQHGMIMNAWINRENQANETCTQDLSVNIVGYGPFRGTSDSGKRLIRPTLADLLRKERGGRVVSLSLKARSAIGMAGHGGEAVLWFDDRGGFVSSTAFAPAAEPSILAYVKAHPIEQAKGSEWTRTLPETRYQYADDITSERPSLGWGVTFPHAFGTDDAMFYGRWQQSPLSDEYLEQMAEAAIDGMHLGAAQGTDFLGVSFSALDLVGHIFGPRSHEVQDVLVRLDATIGRLLDFLDAHVGKDNYILALSADHGVGDIPEQVSGARLSTAEPIVKAIDEALRGVFTDAPPRELRDAIRPFTGDGLYVTGVTNSDVYFRPGIYDRVKKDDRAMTAVIAALGQIPAIARVIRGETLTTAAARNSSDPVVRAAALSYVEGRSGDLVLVLNENAVLSTSAANHGTAYDYDQRIPIIFYGAGIRAGRYDGPASSADIAVTLASRFGLAIPNADGRAQTAIMTQPIMNAR